METTRWTVRQKRVKNHIYFFKTSTSNKLQTFLLFGEKNTVFSWLLKYVWQHVLGSAAVVILWRKQTCCSLSGKFHRVSSSSLLGENRMDMYGCSFPDISLNFPLCQSASSLSSLSLQPFPFPSSITLHYLEKKHQWPVCNNQCFLASISNILH